MRNEVLGDLLLEQQCADAKSITNHTIQCFGHDLPIEQINKPNLKKLANYLKVAVANNTAKTYFAEVRAVINVYRYEYPNLLKLDFNGLSIKKESSIMAYLNEADITKLMKLMNKLGGEERYYYLIMMCQLYVGCRVSDIKKIRRTAIENGILRYVSEKTGIKAEVPVKKGLLEWVKGIEQLQEVYTFCNVTYCKYIKHFCYVAGVNSLTTIYKGGKEYTGEKWKYISSHSLRRSFATNLYLRGADIYSISKMLGHTSVEMTKNYICCGLREMNDIILSFFA